MRSKELNQKVGELILDELIGGKSDKELGDMLKEVFASSMDKGHMYRDSYFGNRIEESAKEYFVKRYVDENFSKLAKSVDLEAIKNLVTISVAKETASRI